MTFELEPSTDTVTEMRRVWEALYLEKAGKRYSRPTETAQFLSIFDGPSGHLNEAAARMKLTCMPPVDTVAKEPIDLMDDVSYCSQVLEILYRGPRFMHGAPPCRFWSHTTNFARGNKQAETRIDEGRKKQRQLMKRFKTLIRAGFAVGCHIMIENPLQSRWWREDFSLAIQAMQDEPEANPHKMVWRSFTADQCRFGRKFKKPTRFMTTAPGQWTKQMELRCDHAKTHSRLLGRDHNGVARTKHMAAYSPQLVTSIAVVAAHAAGIAPELFYAHGAEVNDYQSEASSQLGNTYAMEVAGDIVRVEQQSELNEGSGDIEVTHPDGTRRVMIYSLRAVNAASNRIARCQSPGCLREAIHAEPEMESTYFDDGGGSICRIRNIAFYHKYTYMKRQHDK